MATPQMTLRVSPERLERWKTYAEAQNTSVSEVIRLLMDTVTDAYFQEEKNRRLL